MTVPSETIVAIATPPGRGGVGIVRLSGSRAFEFARPITGGELPPARHARHGRFLDPETGDAIDDGLCLVFPGPNSYTGEDVVEFQGHGGPVVLDHLLQVLVGAGARMARPGEFTERAFLNGRIDLAQAEAVADLIDAGSRAAADAAARTLSGAFSREIEAINQKLIELRVYIEAALDFPEEEIDFLADTRLLTRMDELVTALNQVLDKTAQGVSLREGLQIAIIGQPNAGKSSLLNRLTGDEHAIVTDIPGTTRDVLTASFQIDGLPMHLVDTAGLRHSDDPVEQEGIRRAWQAAEKADVVIHLIDDREGWGDADAALAADIVERLPNTPVLRVFNKIDLSESPAGPIVRPEPVGEALALSARSGDGLAHLEERLKRIAGYGTNREGQYIARRRHLTALEGARTEVEAARSVLRETGSGELAAESLRYAQRHLGEISGQVTADDLLGQIFSSFCIGK